jgi:hypothetical protein
VPFFFDALLRLHLTCAFGATAVFWIAAASRKGGARHRAAGRWFARLICAAAILGGALAIAQLVSPQMVRPAEYVGTTGADAAAEVARTRQMMWLILYVLVIIVAPVQHGLAVIRAGPLPVRVRSRLHAGLSLAGLAGTVLLIPAAIAWQQWTFLVVAPVGFIVGVRNLSYASRPFAAPSEWQREHLTSLLTAGITLHTAFVVLGLSRLLGVTTSGWMQVVPWALPALIGLPVLAWIRPRWTSAKAVQSARGGEGIDPRARS